MKKRKKVKVIVSHPIQYHAVLWRKLYSLDGVDLEVFFCSDHAQEASIDKEFGLAFKWDIPLKRGYSSKTFKNFGFGNGFFKYINLGLLMKLLFSKNDLVYFHGVNHFSAYVSFWIVRLKGTSTIIRNIAHLLGQAKQGKLKSEIRNLIFGSAYRASSYCLYIGSENKNFFKSFKVKEKTLFHAPHVVDNQFFQKRRLHSSEITKLKERIGVDTNAVVLLFCGKMIPIKQPFKLLDAYANSKLISKSCLLMVGDGSLRLALEKKANEIMKNDPQKAIKFLGFKNQTELPAIYSLSEILLLPSKRETWGLVVNEAMNFSNAVIVSDHVGCAPELVHNKAGLVFKNDQVDELKFSIEKLVNDVDQRRKFQEQAFELINGWSVNEFMSTFKKIIERDL